MRKKETLKRKIIIIVCRYLGWSWRWNYKTKNMYKKYNHDRMICLKAIKENKKVQKQKKSFRIFLVWQIFSFSVTYNISWCCWEIFQSMLLLSLLLIILFNVVKVFIFNRSPWTLPEYANYLHQKQK